MPRISSSHDSASMIANDTELEMRPFISSAIAWSQWRLVHAIVFKSKDAPIDVKIGCFRNVAKLLFLLEIQCHRANKSQIQFKEKMRGLNGLLC